MEKLAWPVCRQFLGHQLLAFINSYMVLVFFKTIFLVLVIAYPEDYPPYLSISGVFHALVLLPIVLAVTTRPRYVER
ncbi:hypothetical protein COOONC_24072 [Cooperia oncophora]